MFRFRIKYKNAQYIHTESQIDKIISDGSPCEIDSDCRYEHCLGKCDPKLKMCTGIQQNNNLQIVCQHVSKTKPTFGDPWEQNLTNRNIFIHRFSKDIDICQASWLHQKHLNIWKLSLIFALTHPRIHDITYPVDSWPPLQILPPNFTMKSKEFTMRRPFANERIETIWILQFFCDYFQMKGSL